MTDSAKAPLTAEERAFVTKTLERYGSAYDGGIDMLEKRFVVTVKKPKKKAKVQLELSLPLVGETWEIALGGAPELEHVKHTVPTTPLSGADLQLCDAVLASEGELWLIDPSNGYVVLVPCPRGIVSIREHVTLWPSVNSGDEKVTEVGSYHHAGNHVVTFGMSAWNKVAFVIDPTSRVLIAGCWPDFPDGAAGRLLPKAERDFIEHGLKTYGDFGVYGNVQCTLKELMEGQRLQIGDDGQMYHFNTSPKDGHGHWLSFSMSKKTGEISGCAAGHSVSEMPDEPEM